MFGHDSQCHIWRKQNTISTNTSYQLLVVVDRGGFGLVLLAQHLWNLEDIEPNMQQDFGSQLLIFSWKST